MPRPGFRERPTGLVSHLLFVAALGVVLALAPCGAAGAQTETPTPAPTVTPAGLSHFQCFEIHGAPRDLAGIALTDAFGASTVTVKRAKRLCAPADKNGEDPDAPTDPEHLTAYTIKQTSPRFRRARVGVTNQFGAMTLEVVKPDRLLVPTAKSLTGFPPPLANAIDHFKCYRVKGACLRAANLSVDTQFGSSTVDIKRPSHVCLPVDKNGEGIVDPAAQLTCYQVRGRQAVPDSVFTTDQFGGDQLGVYGPRELCVPSTGQMCTSPTDLPFSRRSCDPFTPESGQVTIIAPEDGASSSDFGTILAIVEPPSLYETLFARCVGGVHDGSMCDGAADCSGGFCDPPANVAEFEVLFGGVWFPINEHAVPDLGNLVAVSFGADDFLAGPLELRVRIAPASCGDDTIAADQVSVKAPTPTPTETPPAETPTPTPSPTTCGCQKMSIVTAGNSTIAMTWMPEALQRQLGPYNTVNLANPEPYQLKFNFEVQADLANGSNPAFCPEGQEVARTSAEGDRKNPGKVVEAYKKACSAGKIGNDGAECKLDRDCSLYTCKGGSEDGKDCSTGGRAASCVFENGNENRPTPPLATPRCLLTAKGKCTEFKFGGGARGNDDFSSIRNGYKQRSAASINWVDGPGFENARKATVTSGGLKWQADFRSFVLGSDKNQPSCDCTYTVEFEVDKTGAVVTTPRINPGSLMVVAGTCVEAQRPTPTPTATPTATLTPTPTPTATP